jgi:ATP-dependent helicase HepA
MPPVHVKSKLLPDWGPARLIPKVENNEVVLEYFVTPGTLPLRVKAPLDSLVRPEYERGQRVYFRVEDGSLRSGRIAETGLAASHTVREEYPGPAENNVPVVLVTATGGRKLSVRPEDLDLASTVPIDDPSAILRAQATEGTWWYHTRTRLRRALVEQRQSFRGLTALASSSVELHEHQLAVALTVLRDPVCRYILADEVGLGKTIEAGIVLRQHLLDTQSDLGALVIIPPHLRNQWESELRRKFHLGSDLDQGRVILTSPREATSVASEYSDDGPPPMVIVDEAHHLSALAYSESEADREYFRALSELINSAEKVLLLSATPVLRDTAGFLAMLNLLESRTHRLGDIEVFRTIVEKRQVIAELASALRRPVRRSLRRGTMARIREELGHDSHIMELSNSLEVAWESADDSEGDRIQAELLAYIQNSYRIYRRLLRTRRNSESLTDALPRRSLERIEFDSPLAFTVTDGLESWRERLLLAADYDEISAEVREMFADWVSASLSGYLELRHHLRLRVASIEGGSEHPLFEGELPLLEELREAIDSGYSDHLDGLVGALPPARQGVRRIVFCESEGDARCLAQVIPGRPGVLGEDGVIPSTNVIIVTRMGEEGLNLQQERSELVHVTLPLSPVRIEQRIGRVDRLTASDVAVRSIVAVPDGTYESAWHRLLVEAGRVFDESVSGLQYLLAEAVSAIRDALLQHGPDAFEMARVALTSQGHPLSIDDEVRRIEEQDILDALPLVREVRRHFETLDGYEFDGNEGQLAEFEDAVLQWFAKGLDFAVLDRDARQIDGALNVPDGVRLRISDRHLPRSTVYSHFAAAIDIHLRSPHVRPGVRATFPFVTRRSRRAITAGIPLLRAGHPLIDGLDRLLRSDDRGRTFALDASAGATEVHACFRFDVLCAPDSEDEFAVMRRRLDEIMRPQFFSFWLSADGQPVDDDLDSRLEGLVVESGTPSIRGAAEWEEVLGRVSFPWSETVEARTAQAHETARTFIDRNGAGGWEGWVRRGCERIEDSREAARLLVLARRAAGVPEEEDEVVNAEFGFLDRMEEIARGSAPRLESVGVVFFPSSAITG